MQLLASLLAVMERLAAEDCQAARRLYHLLTTATAGSARSLPCHSQRAAHMQGAAAIVCPPGRLPETDEATRMGKAASSAAPARIAWLVSRALKERK